MRRNKIRAGIIGCGRIAGWYELDPFREKPCTHIGAYRTQRNVDVVGCCDLNFESAERFARHFKLNFFTDSIQELLSQQLDILSICVPYKSNFQCIKQVISSQPKPQKIFMEKPISDDLTKARKIVDLCRQHRIKLYINNRRLSTFYQTFQRIIRQRFNNKIISLSAWCSSGIHAIGIHLVDLLRFISGEVEWVFAVKEKERISSLPYSDNFTPDDPRFHSLLSFKNGVKAALFNTARTDFTYFEIEALCEMGRIRAADNGKKMLYQKKIKPGQSTLSFRLGREQSVKIKPSPLFRKVIEEILYGDYEDSPLNAEEALKSYRVVEAMMTSALSHSIQYL